MKHGFIVDFTLDEGGKLHIIELGNLLTSETQGYDVLHPEQTIQDKYLDLQRQQADPAAYFVHISSWSLKTPRWIIRSLDPEVNQKLKDEYGFSLDLWQPKSKLACERLKNMLLALAASTSSNTSIILKIDQPILSSSPELQSFVDWFRSSEACKRSRLKLMVMHDEFHQVCKSKRALLHWIKDSPISPRTITGDSLNLQAIQQVKAFVDASTEEYFILKPDGEARGRGVVVLTRDHVTLYLHSILKGTCDDPFWLRKKEAPFLVQVCHPSKTITASNGKIYRPTGRLVFAGDLSSMGSFTFLGAYWKLPKQSLSGDTTFTTGNIVSKISDRAEGDDPTISALVSEEDTANVLRQFYSQFMPILETRTQAHPHIQPTSFSQDLGLLTTNPTQQARYIADYLSILNGPYDTFKTPKLAYILAGASFELASVATQHHLPLTYRLFLEGQAQECRLIEFFQANPQYFSEDQALSFFARQSLSSAQEPAQQISPAALPLPLASYADRSPALPPVTTLPAPRNAFQAGNVQAFPASFLLLLIAYRRFVHPVMLRIPRVINTFRGREPRRLLLEMGREPHNKESKPNRKAGTRQ